MALRIMMDWRENDCETYQRRRNRCPDPGRDKTGSPPAQDKHNLVPGLATILLGSDPVPSPIFPAKKNSQRLGFYSARIDLPESTSQQDLLAVIDKLNKDPKIHGILVQEPDLNILMLTK